VVNDHAGIADTREDDDDEYKTEEGNRETTRTQERQGNAPSHGSRG
jgi:hypothetical protein